MSWQDTHSAVTGRARFDAPGAPVLPWHFVHSLDSKNRCALAASSPAFFDAWGAWHERQFAFSSEAPECFFESSASPRSWQSAQSAGTFFVRAGAATPPCGSWQLRHSPDSTGGWTVSPSLPMFPWHFAHRALGSLRRKAARVPP